MKNKGGISTWIYSQGGVRNGMSLPYTQLYLFCVSGDWIAICIPNGKRWYFIPNLLRWFCGGTDTSSSVVACLTRLIELRGSVEFLKEKKSYQSALKHYCVIKFVSNESSIIIIVMYWVNRCHLIFPHSSPFNVTLRVNNVYKQYARRPHFVALVVTVIRIPQPWIILVDKTQ